MAFLYPEEGTDGKTERGSEKKRTDSRKEGKVVVSNEVITIAVLGAAIVTFLVTLPLMRHYLTGLMKYWAQIDLSGDWNVEFVKALLWKGAMVCALGVFPIGLAVLLSSIVANVAQTRPYFETEVLKLNFKALNPVTGAKQLFSNESVIKLLLSMLKVIVIALVVWGVVRQQIEELTFLHRLSIPEGVQWFFSVFSKIVWRVMALFIVVAVLDWIKEKRKYEKSIMMTKQEVKEEQKNQESSPQMKQRMRSKMRELSTARMMASVPDATVVITNPTFLAIAIKYDSQSGNAPIVVAKGKRLVAHHIRDLATQNGVPIIERKPLARAMYNKVEIGKPVPAAYYEAIAELLAHLYRLGDIHIREQLAPK